MSQHLQNNFKSDLPHNGQDSHSVQLTSITQNSNSSHAATEYNLINQISPTSTTFSSNLLLNNNNSKSNNLTASLNPRVRKASLFRNGMML